MGIGNTIDYKPKFKEMKVIQIFAIRYSDCNCINYCYGICNDKHLFNTKVTLLQRASDLSFMLVDETSKLFDINHSFRINSIGKFTDKLICKLLLNGNDNSSKSYVFKHTHYSIL